MGKLVLFITFILGCALLDNVSGRVVSKAATLPWWQQSVVYQIYPRSFQDSNGDGVGDLNGIKQKMDYFLDLGIDAIWISPFFKSPMADFGYDISDFRDVDPIFGTLDDFRALATAFKENGIKLILDMVPNHSSDLHEWFIKSADRVEPYTDYYVWKDAKGNDTDGNPIPPTNWVSAFAGSSWEWNEKRQQFYLHQFVKEQPDLNYENPAVRNEMLAVFKFWLDAGVDGFRVDAVPFIYEDQRFLDEPENPDRPPEALPDEYRYWDHLYTYNLPAVLDFLADVRQLMDIYSATDGVARCMMVEAGVSDDKMMEYYGNASRPVAHFPFNFKLLNVRPDMTAKQVQDLIQIWFDRLPEGEWPTFLIGNHDQKRAATRWTEETIDGANMINLLLQGTAVTYYGEEIGMVDTFLSWDETVDPAACNTDPQRYEFFSRDPARTPMQWDSTVGGGFSTTNNTWLPLNPNYQTLNVAAQEAAEESHLKVYQELLKIRNTDAWRFGSYETLTLNNDKVLGFTRTASAANGGGSYLVLVSFTNSTETIDASVFAGAPAQGKVLVKSINFSIPETVVGGNIDTSAIILGPRNSIVLELSPLIKIKHGLYQ